MRRRHTERVAYPPPSDKNPGGVCSDQGILHRNSRTKSRAIVSALAAALKRRDRSYIGDDLGPESLGDGVSMPASARASARPPSGVFDHLAGPAIFRFPTRLPESRGSLEPVTDPRRIRTGVLAEMARILHRTRPYCTVRAIGEVYVLARGTSDCLIIPRRGPGECGGSVGCGCAGSMPKVKEWGRRRVLEISDLPDTSRAILSGMGCSLNSSKRSACDEPSPVDWCSVGELSEPNFL